MADKTWSCAGAPFTASTNANWSGGAVPAAGDNIIFDNTSDQNCTWDLGTLTYGAFNMNAGYDGTVTQASAIQCSNATIASGTFTGDGSSNFIISGNFTHSGGTITADLLKIYVTGAGKTLTFAGTPGLFSIYCSVSCVLASSITLKATTGFLTVQTGTTLTMNAAQAWTDVKSSTVGTVAGTGSFAYTYNSLSDATFRQGATNVPISLTLAAGAAASRTLTTSGICSYGGTFGLSSSHAANTLTYTSAHNNTFTGAVTIGDRGILTQTGGTWSFGDDLTIDGESAVVTMGGAWTVTGDVTLAEGTLNLNGKALTCGSFTQTGGTLVYNGGTINGVGESNYPTNVAVQPMTANPRKALLDPLEVIYNG